MFGHESHVIVAHRSHFVFEDLHMILESRHSVVLPEIRQVHGMRCGWAKGPCKFASQARLLAGLLVKPFGLVTSGTAHAVSGATTPVLMLAMWLPSF